MGTVGHFFFLQVFTLILVVQARLNLETTDHEALLAIYNDLGVSTGSNSICNAAGIFCKFPSGLSSLVRLRILDLSSNKFSGDLNFLNHFPNLEKLSLANNMFTGKVPASLRSFRNLRFFNISGNSVLEGTLPTMNKLESPSTEYNKLVPKRYIFTESNSSTNEGTKSHNLQTPAPSPTGEPIHNYKNKKKRVIRWILGFSVGAVAVIICGAIFSVVFKLKLNMINGKKNEFFGPVIFSQLIKAEDLAFLEKDDVVASLQVIGKEDITELTDDDDDDDDTKLLSPKMRQIKSEIQTDGQIRHRNLLPLLAHVYWPSWKFPSDEFFLSTYEISLVKWMRNLMVGEDPEQVLDPQLRGNGFEEQMLLVLRIACFCTLDDPKERPNSKDAKTMLTQINH
ncbi:hypothetical protein L1987_51808 [Smallanthus sonchifolius]|uniref:Uncharacterized protein n=1 Tax=Smallanthus sonchifolius TaxID=185202 RepID=A0ACB9EQT3_9ASTR|nr:hypothetical protein L1987_51808 [Smallanthus sonchifolius]